jgi:hypothetical protein
MSNAAIGRRAITQYSADVTPLDEELTVGELALALEQLTFTRERGFECPRCGRKETMLVRPPARGTT